MLIKLRQTVFYLVDKSHISEYLDRFFALFYIRKNINNINNYNYINYYFQKIIIKILRYFYFFIISLFANQTQKKYV